MVLLQLPVPQSPWMLQLGNQVWKSSTEGRWTEGQEWGRAHFLPQHISGKRRGAQECSLDQRDAVAEVRLRERDGRAKLASKLATWQALQKTSCL